MPYTQLGPVAFASLTDAQKQALASVNYMTVGDIDGDELSVFKNGQWTNVPLFAGTKHDGDILTWAESSSLWVPASDVNVIGSLSGQRAFFLGNYTNVIEVRRTWKDFDPAFAPNSTGTVTPWGDHTYTADTFFKIEIDTAGNETNATFRWSQDAGVTWAASLVPINITSRIYLANNLFLLWSPGTYVLGNYWLFTAVGTASQLYDLKVDSQSSIVKVGYQLQLANDSNNVLEPQAATLFPRWRVSSVPESLFFARTLKEWIFEFSNYNTYVGAGYVQLPQRTTPSTPSSGFAKIYVKQDPITVVNSIPFILDESGVERSLLGSADAIYGDGSDAALTVGSGVTTTLTRTMYYTSVTLTDATSTLATAGFMVFCNTLLTLNGGSINVNGGVGTNGGNSSAAGGGAAGSPGGAAGGALGDTSAGVIGGAGGAGGAPTLNGSNGVASSGINSSDGGNGGNGGIGGDGIGVGHGTAGATVGSGAAIINIRRLRTPLSAIYRLGATALGAGAGGGGGTGGGGGAAGLGGGGGGGAGGGGGGVLWLAARSINATTGNISANGGKGGDGGSGAAGGVDGGAGGGGGGGGGGVVYMIYDQLTTGGTITATAGAKGVKGAGTGTPADGVIGSAGHVIQVDLGAGTVTTT